MPDWVWTLIIGGSGGGLFGYWLRARVDEHFAERTEARQFKQSDLRALRDDLFVFLGEPRAHFTWLQDVPDVKAAGGSPSPDQKAQIIADWVYKNVSRFPKDRRGPMYLILNTTYQLARGDRHFLDAYPKGYEALHDAWEALDDYAQDLTRLLRGT